MKKYKASVFELVRLSVSLVFGCAVAAIILSLFIRNDLLLMAICGLIVLICVFVVAADARLSVQVDGTTLKQYKGGKLAHEFVLAECSFASRTASGSNTVGTDRKLQITDKDGFNTTLDCSILGQKAYEQLLDQLGFFDKAPQKLDLTQN